MVLVGDTNNKFFKRTDFDKIFTNLATSDRSNYTKDFNIKVLKTVHQYLRNKIPTKINAWL